MRSMTELYIDLLTVQAKAAGGVVVKGTHLKPAKVTLPAQGLVTH
jgi:hypothetical protein